MSARVLRYVVPVDDQPHSIGAGAVAHIAARDHGTGAHDVEVWTIETDAADGFPGPLTLDRTVQVFGTGQPLPDDGATHLGSTFDAATDRLVWHVFEVIA